MAASRKISLRRSTGRSTGLKSGGRIRPELSDRSAFAGPPGAWPPQPADATQAARTRPVPSRRRGRPAEVRGFGPWRDRGMAYLAASRPRAVVEGRAGPDLTWADLILLHLK